MHVEGQRNSGLCADMPGILAAAGGNGGIEVHQKRERNNLLRLPTTKKQRSYGLKSRPRFQTAFFLAKGPGQWVGVAPGVGRPSCADPPADDAAVDRTVSRRTM
jgi:hypothetical protein